MISQEELKEFMRQRVAEDRAMRSVTVSGDTLEEALHNAVMELDLPLRRIEYDIIQKGTSGTFGFGKRPWSLLAFEAQKIVKKEKEEEAFGVDLVMDSAKEESQDGKVFIRLWHDGAYIKVVKPLGQGTPIEEDQALDLLHSRGIRDINSQVLKGAVKLATGSYGKVGEYNHNPLNDTLINIDVEDQDMLACVTLTPAGSGGADVSQEEIESFLKSNGIVHGFMFQDIENLVDQPTYNHKVSVATGTKPIHGQDAKITYFFDTQSRIRPTEVEGRVDFKELNTIHNVIKGEDLAKKDPAQKGTPGRTVTGKIIPAKDGKDVTLELGNNVSISDDGLRVTATADGQVMLIQNRITVETVMVISGDVDTSVGKINFLGSVVVKGNVEDGFDIKAVGNIEIMGNVGKASLDSQADVIIHQGINGGGEGKISAGQSIWSKFIQNAEATAGSFIVVSDGILHSNVTAGKKILCKGKRAKIVGGYIRASEEINATSLGAVGTDATVLEVGFDPKVKAELEALINSKETLEKEINTDTLNIQALLKQEKIAKTLPPEKEEMKKKLMSKIVAAKSNLSQVTETLDKRQQELDSLKFSGKISSSGLVYPGTKIIIKDVEYEVNREYNSVTFIRDGNLVRTVKYEDIEEGEISRK